MAQDRFGRSINYLRISLTDKCNLRCVYCMAEDMVFRPNEQLMQTDELADVGSPIHPIGLPQIPTDRWRTDCA